MPSQLTAIQYLTVVQIGSYLLLLRKLFRSGIWRKYRNFSYYLAFECIRIPTMSMISVRSNAYGYAYFATQPVIWLLYILIVFSLSQSVLKNHKGIATLGRKVLSWALAISAGVSIATLLFDLQHRTTDSAFLYNFMLLERLIMTSLLLLVLSLLFFLSYFPVPLTKNVRVHASIFAVFFAARTALLFVRTLVGPEQVVMLNTVAYIVMIGCLWAWIGLMTVQGELLPDRARPASGSEARLLAQLNSINETLLRSSRK